MSADVDPDGSEKTELVLVKASDWPMPHGGTANEGQKDQPAELEGEPGAGRLSCRRGRKTAAGATVESLNTENHVMLSGVTDASATLKSAPSLREIIKLRQRRKTGPILAR